MGEQEGTPTSTSARVVGRYALHHPIASGGMATVYLGRVLGAVGFSRVVAIKCLHAHLAADPDTANMFIDEARMAARVRHPNVVPTLDTVEADGEVMIVMEYVEGESLSRLIAASSERGEPIALPIVSRVIQDVLAGLEAAHTATDERGALLNLVHRDVSPHNVIVGTDGMSRLIDFGVAKARGRIRSTRDGGLKGKLGYMAPEQLQGQGNHQSDIFSASVVLWEALAGRRLFEGTNEGAMLNLLLNEPIRAPSESRSEIPVELEAVVMRGLSRNIGQRYASAAEMGAALGTVAPAASMQTVAQWVRKLASDRMDSRAAQIRELECTPSALLTPMPVTPEPSEPSEPTAEQEQPLAVAPEVSRERRSSRSMAFAGLLAIAGLLAVLFIGTSLLPGGDGSPSTSQPALPSAATGLTTTGPTQPREAAATDTVSAPVSSFTTPPEPLVSGIAPTATLRRVPPTPAEASVVSPETTTTPPGSAEPSIRPDCAQPTYRDDGGIVRYKVDCL